MTDYSELKERLEKRSGDVARKAMGGAAPATVSIPANENDIDVIMSEAAAAITALEAEIERLTPKPSEYEHLTSVCYRHGEPTVEDYDEAIGDLARARNAISKCDTNGCAVCGDSGCSVESCHHNPLVLARQWAHATHFYQCYHCGFIATTDEEAREHFGKDENDNPLCITALEAEIKRLGNRLEYDRSEVAGGIAAVENAIKGREWLREGRGCYEYDDDRWKDEFGGALDEIREALQPLRRIAKDWSDCPTEPDDIKQARISELERLRARVAELEDKLERAESLIDPDHIP